eukprot:gnl/MRDRNA2_/MRDRNA2_106307_c0_seq1.p1 gnl/MRDRNA2_/MRDRNA2_106307_c0~~gnl/MRDRNA2_/MRDRNA2_106307_c0_seq1.p1  ORF type:complete len:475 (-),score=79.44 gnl/MRDRNA2_/MRDRNA2_106307_c0_seq1:25-1284(-)
MSHGSPPIIFALYRCAGGMACCILALKLCPELGTKTRKEKGQTIFGDSVLSMYQERNGYSRKDELMFTLLGLCQAGNICGFIIANTMLPALTCSIFAPLVPVGTAFISIAWGIEDRDRTKLIGLCTAVVGAMIVIMFEGHAAQAPPVPLTTMTAMTTAMAKPLANTSAHGVANATVKALANGTVANAVANGTVAKAVANATGVTVANATKVIATNATKVAAASATKVATKAAAAAVVPTVAASWKVCGYCFLLLSTTSAAMYFVLLKSVLKTYTPVRATAMAYSHATGFILLAALFRHGLDPMAWFLYGDGVAWLCLIYAAAITTGLTYTIQAWAIGQTSPSTVTAFSTLSPVAAAMISVAFLNVHLKTYQLVGGMLIIGGLWINITVQAREEKAREKVPLLKPSEYGLFSTPSPYDTL